jgi:hypothetical protein
VTVLLASFSPASLWVELVQMADSSSSLDQSQLRQRKHHDNNGPATITAKDIETLEHTEKGKNILDDNNLLSDSYWLVRVIFIRSLAFIYFVAFLVAFHQNKQLIGKDGLLPADHYMENIRISLQSRAPSNPAVSQWSLFSHLPTCLWWIPQAYIDLSLDVMACMGIVLSALLIILGSANVIILFTLWGLYQSITNVGQRWYSFGEWYVVWNYQIIKSFRLGVSVIGNGIPSNVSEPIDESREVPSSHPN